MQLPAYFSPNALESDVMCIYVSAVAWILHIKHYQGLHFLCEKGHTTVYVSYVI